MSPKHKIVRQVDGTVKYIEIPDLDAIDLSKPQFDFFAVRDQTRTTYTGIQGDYSPKTYEEFDKTNMNIIMEETGVTREQARDSINQQREIRKEQLKEAIRYRKL